MAITYYRELVLPAGGVAAAQACLDADPPRPPGSADEFVSTANRLGLIAQALRDALATLARIADDGSVWTGQAADAFWTLLRDPQRAHYDQVPERYDGYARALRAYAADLSGHQASVDGARTGVQAALDAYRRVVATAPPPPQSLSTSTSFTMPTPDTDPRHICAIQECAAAARRFQTAYNAWIAAAAACQHAVKKVDGDKLHNPHGASAVPGAIDTAFHAVVDAVATVADAASTLTGILALITLPWPPVAGFLLLVSTLTSGVQLAADLDRRMQYGEKVTGADFAFDALGTVPFGKPGSAAVKAGRAARAAGLLAALHTGGDTFGRTIAAEVAGTFSINGIKRTVRDLAQVDRRPAPKAVRPGLGQISPAEDLAVTTAQAGTEAYDNRRRGPRAVERATLEVALGPIGSPAAAAVDAGRDSLGKLPRLATAGAP